MWPVDDQTKELLEQVRAGSEGALNDLMERHREALRQIVRMRLDRKIQKRVDVSDVVQDVLVEANRRLRDYIDNPVMTFRVWLRQIAQDRVIDAHRRHRASARRSVDREQGLEFTPASHESSIQLANVLHDPELTPHAQAIQRELANRVEVAILELDETDQEIVVMRHYEHLTNQEISQALGLTEPAASMRYLRAIRRLKSNLRAPGRKLDASSDELG